MPKPDFNLLVTLDAVLRERSVTKAAERLGVSQPAVSAALARLRVYFSDELIYRTSGNTYSFTPLAVSLAARTSAALQTVQDIFTLEPPFDPGSCEREFMIVCSDYGATVIGAPVAQELAKVAPGVRLRLTQTSLTPFTEDPARLRSVDGIIMPHGILDGRNHLDLFSDDWVCVVSAGNTSVGDRLTLPDLSRLQWVTNFPQPWPGGALRQLAELGVQLRVQVQVDTFLRVPQFVAGTDRIAVMPRRLAQLALPHAALRIMQCPFDVHPTAQALWWDPVFDRDPEHAWLRGQFAAISRTVKEELEGSTGST